MTGQDRQGPLEAVMDSTATSIPDDDIQEEGQPAESRVKPRAVDPKRRLQDALIQTYCDGQQLADTLRRLKYRWERDPGGPKNWHLPIKIAREHRAKVDAQIAKKDGPGASMCWGEWVELLDAVSQEYPAFKKSEQEATKLIGGVAKDMDDSREPATKRWTFRARDELGKLMDSCQVHKWGLQGHRFWMQAPDDPKDLLAALERVRLLARDLWCAGACDEPAPAPAEPTSKKAAPPSPPQLWQGDPWKDPSRTVDERVRFYMAKLGSMGKTERPTCREVATEVAASAGGVASYDAWEAWGKAEQRGAAVDRVERRQSQQSKRIEAEQIRQEDDED
jgi:hypothetical protein